MQLSKAQITEILSVIASGEDGFNELLQITFEALMQSERREHLQRIEGDKGNGYRNVRAYGNGKML